MTQNIKSRSRKQAKSSGNEYETATKFQTLKESVTKNLCCALGNLFGLQPSQNADAGPERSSKHTAMPNTTPSAATQSSFTASQSANQHIFPDSRTKKSIFWAYVLWIFGGFFGLHLFYLERDDHAFLTWSTVGGYGLGWLADITKIPRYVKDCNDDPKFIEELVERMRRNRKPPFSTSRFISALMVGYLWGQLVMLAIPEEEIYGINLNTYLHWLIPQAVAFGVWVVGNIGREQGTPKFTLIATNLSYLSRWYFYDENVWLTIVMFTAAFAFDTFDKEWRRQPKKKKSLKKRITILFFCAVLYGGLWSSYLYFNGKITDSNGDEIPIHEALHHFFTSPWWTDLKQSLYDIYQYAQQHGWYEIWKQIIELSDPQGEQNAYKVLGVSPTASQQEITARWRALSRENHPDKCKDPDKQKESQDKFMEIQQAYEILSKIKNKRRRKNKKSVTEN